MCSVVHKTSRTFGTVFRRDFGRNVCRARAVCIDLRPEGRRWPLPKVCEALVVLDEPRIQRSRPEQMHICQDY